MEEASVEILSPILSTILLFLSIALGVILLIAFAYLWSMQKQDREELERLSIIVKNLSKKIKELENPMPEKNDLKKIDKIVEAKPVEIPIEKNTSSSLKDDSQSSWELFIENYNHIAKSMAVPGQLKACENFVAENKLTILICGSNAKFTLASSVSESRVWAWKWDENDKYIVVPNPMIAYDEELHIHGGMKKIFISDYKSGVYSTYFVEKPAIFACDKKNEWKILELGFIKLEA